MKKMICPICDREVDELGKDIDGGDMCQECLIKRCYTSITSGPGKFYITNTLNVEIKD